MKLIFLGLLINFVTFEAIALNSLSYSGRLVNPNGSPVTGPVDLRFILSYTGTPATQRCGKILTDVPLSKGVFHVKLDFTAADCSNIPLTTILSNVPTGESAAIQVSDLTHTKDYTYQALHSTPASIMANMAKTLHQMGANSGEYLMWDGAKWIPSAITGATGGTITEVSTGTGLSGGPITTTGTISIANSGVNTLQLADGAVTDSKIANGITRNKLVNGSPNYVLVNNGSGVISEASHLTIAQGGTGATSVSGAWTSLGLGTSAGFNYMACLSGQVSKFIIPGGWTCVSDTTSDNTKLPLAGGVMTGSIDMNSSSILNLATPANPNDAANKAYVDAKVGSVSESQWITTGSDIHYDTGNVGVGTTTPTHTLDLTGTARFTTTAINGGSGAIVLGTAGNNNRPIFGMGSSTDNSEFRIVNAGDWRVGTRIGAPLSFMTNNLQRLYIDTAGNVGVGIISPASILHVNGDATVDGKLRLKSDTANFVELRAPSALTGNIIFSLPNSLGTSGQALITDGAGNLSWTTVATGSTSVGGDLSGTMSSATINNNAVTSAKIADTTIVDADIALTANIAQSKIAGLATTLSGKEDTIAAGSTTQYFSGDKTWQTLNTTAVAEGTRLYFTEQRVLDTDLAGFATSSGSVSATDTVLSAIGKLAGNQGLYVMKTGDSMIGSLSMGGNTISGVAVPTAGDHAVNKNYVDTAISGSTHWSKVGSTINFSAGNVGIGTTSPTEMLEVAGNLKAIGTGTHQLDRILITRPGVDGKITSGSGYLRLAGAGTHRVVADTQLQLPNSGIVTSISDFNIIAGADDASPTRDIVFQSKASELVRIKSSGYVGVGTSNPAGTLHVSGTMPTYFDRFGSLGTHLLMRRATGTQAAPLAVPAGEGVGTFTGQGFDGTNYNNVARIQFLTSENVTPTSSGGSINFATSNLGSNVLQNRMTISPAGNVGIGLTAPTAGLHLKAGSNTANTAPLKFSSGPLLTAPEVGTLEFDGSKFYYTDGSSTRKTLASGSSPSFTGEVSTDDKVITPSVYGSTAASGNIVIDSTTNASKGDVIVAPSGGDVGIGTSTPYGMLANSATDVTDQSGVGIGSMGLNWMGASAGYVAAFENKSVGAGYNGVLVKTADTSANSLILNTMSGSASRMVVRSDGNVGIGTTNPSAKLEISGGETADQARLVFSASDSSDRFTVETDLEANTVNDTLGFRSVTADNILVLKGSGNVGIGTSAPTAKLTLNGDLLMTGFPNASAGSRFISLDRWTDQNISGAWIEFESLGNATGAGQGMHFGTHHSGYSNARRMTITKDGNVGIGTTTPNSKLTVKSAGTIQEWVDGSNISRLSVRTDATTTTISGESNGVGTSALVLRSNNNSPTTIAAHNGSVNLDPGPYDGSNSYSFNGSGVLNVYVYDTGKVLASQLNMGLHDTTNDLGQIHLQPVRAGALQTGMIVKALAGGGSAVGIGTTTPAAKLEINGSSTSDVEGLRIANTIPYGSGVQSSTISLGKIEGVGWQPMGVMTAGPSTAGNSTEGELWFSTRSASAVSERMRIDNVGNVGIGTNNPTVKLEVIGDVRAAGFIATSDRRLKTNLSKSQGFETLSQLNGYKFNWRDTGRTEYGVMAQEVEKVMPEIVETNPDTGVKAVKYNGLFAPIIESIKEIFVEITGLNKKIHEQDRKIASLEQKNKELEERLNRIEESLPKQSAKK